MARTGVERYRYLCRDHPSPTVRAQYTELVFRLAAEPEAPRPTAAAQLELLAAVRSCPFRSTPATGCSCGRCGLAGGKRVNISECMACVKAYR